MTNDPERGSLSRVRLSELLGGCRPERERLSMLETWVQWTCDGCGETEYHGDPDATKTDVRAFLKACGWKSYGRLDYCRKCAASGAAKRRSQAMGADCEPPNAEFSGGPLDISTTKDGRGPSAATQG